MSDMSTQIILFNLPLPYFLIDLKNAFNSVVIPRLNIIITDIQKQQSNSSILSLLILIFLFLVLKTIIGNLFVARPVVNKPVSQSQVDEEIRALANEIRNLKNSLRKIIQQASKSAINSASVHIQTKQSIKTQDVTKLMKHYKESASDFNELAEFILESLESIFKEIKNIKKIRGSAEKTSSNGSRQQSPFQILQTPKQLQQSKSVDTDVNYPQEKETNPVEEVQPKRIPKQFKPPVPITKKRGVPPPPVPR